MQMLSCPFEKNYCQAANSFVSVSPEAPDYQIDLQNSNFVSGSFCYFEVSVVNSTFNNDKYNYTLKAAFSGLNNVGVSISNGTSFWDAKDKFTVGSSDGYSFQYSPHNGQKLFVVVQGKSTTSGAPSMTAQFRLSKRFIGE